MKKIIILLLFLSSIFGDYILLDRLETAKHKICPISKKERKRLFLLEIRQKENNTSLYIFEKKENKYKFIDGFDLSFMGKEVYFEGYVNEKSKKFKKNYIYYCDPKKNKMANFIFLVGGEFSKKEVLDRIKKVNDKYKKKGDFSSKRIRRKKSFYAKKYINLFIPEKKELESFFTYTSTKAHRKINFDKELKKASIGYYRLISSGISGSMRLTLNAFIGKIIKITPEEKSFRDKYYFDLSDLKKQDIPEPTPMWDAKVKPYKNVFGEELLD